MAASIQILLKPATTNLIFSELKKDPQKEKSVRQKLFEVSFSKNMDQEKLKWAIATLYGVSTIKVEATSREKECFLTFDNDNDASKFIQNILPAIDQALDTTDPNTLTYSELKAQRETLLALKQKDVSLIKTPSTILPLYPALSPSPYSPAPSGPSSYSSSSSSSSAASAPAVPQPSPLGAQPRYRVVMSDEAVQKANRYLAALKAGQASPGTRLAEILRANQINLQQRQDYTTLDFIDLLLQTKMPQIFAERTIEESGLNPVPQWAQIETSILGDINIAMDATVYDNGNHRAPTPHQNPFTASLLYTPGAVLTQSPNPQQMGNGQMPYPVAPNPDYAEIISNGMVDRAKFKALYARRLLPLLIYANDQAKYLNQRGFIAVPGIGCGQFAGAFSQSVQALFPDILQEIVWENSDKLPYIAAVYCAVDSKQSYEVKQTPNKPILIFDKPYVRINERGQPLDNGIEPVPLLAEPTSHGEQYANCRLFKIVAWDHFSWPGNDFYHHYNRTTDDGVAAAATDTISRVTGIPGNYQAGHYYAPGQERWHIEVERLKTELAVKGIYPEEDPAPPALKDWRTLIQERNLKLSTQGKVMVVHCSTRELMEYNAMALEAAIPSFVALPPVQPASQSPLRPTPMAFSAQQQQIVVQQFSPPVLGGPLPQIPTTPPPSQPTLRQTSVPFSAQQKPPVVQHFSPLVPGGPLPQIPTTLPPPLPQGQYAAQSPQGHYAAQQPQGQYAAQSSQGHYAAQQPQAQYAAQSSQGQYAAQPPQGQYAAQPPQAQYAAQQPQAQYAAQSSQGQYAAQSSQGQYAAQQPQAQYAAQQPQAQYAAQQPQAQYAAQQPQAQYAAQSSQGSYAAQQPQGKYAAQSSQGQYAAQQPQGPYAPPMLPAGYQPPAPQWNSPNSPTFFALSAVAPVVNQPSVSQLQYRSGQHPPAA